MSSLFGMPSSPKPRRPPPAQGITPAIGQAVLVSHNKVTDADNYCSIVWEIVAVSPQACVVKPASARVFQKINPGPYMLWFRDHEFYDATPIIDGLLRDEREQGLMTQPVQQIPERAELGHAERLLENFFNLHLGDDD